jgi:hypothetical protein
MLNFAEQTGSGAVIVVWSLLYKGGECKYIYTAQTVDVTYWYESRWAVTHSITNLLVFDVFTAAS